MKHRIHFTKMHGLGNDFILVDAINQRISDEEVESLAKKLCNRNFGIGADGLVLVKSSDQTDLKMQIINADGSEPEMCGNGIRCLVRYLYDNNRLRISESISVETLAGKIQATVEPNNYIKVNMGRPIIEPKLIPTLLDSFVNKVPQGTAILDSNEFNIYALESNERNHKI